MKNKIKNLLALAVSGLMFSSCSVFAMKQGGRPGYKKKDLICLTIANPRNCVPQGHVPPKLREKTVCVTGEKTVCVTAKALSYQDYFDQFINNLNSMNETVINVRLPDANELPSGITLEDCQGCIRMRCPGKTINFV